MLVRSSSCRALCGVVAAALLVATTVAAAAPAAPPRVDPKIERVFRTGVLGPWSRGKPQPGRAPVLVELAQPATAAALAALRSAGARLAQVDGKILFYDRFVPAEVTPGVPAALAALPEVARVRLLPARGPMPLDHSAELIRLADARGSRPALDLMTGAGVVVGDVDSLVDVFHPTFFRGDGGYYDWIDVDGDGVLTPGVDAIDLDRNGVADPSEVAVLIQAATYSDDTRDVVDARPKGFDPSIDWLYLDTNANEQRDYGAAGGFDDTAPAFGEPLFVPDDVNRNGKVDVGERVVRLGTSKFRKVYLDLDYDSVKVAHTFARGTDLATLKPDYFGGAAFGYADALHATGVLTIVAGDVPLVGRRWVGLAPEAELVLGWEVDNAQSLPLKGTTWALSEKPDVMLYELAPWTGVELDGSDALSALIDTSNQKDGVTHTCPTGDQGSAQKHTHAALAAGGVAALPLIIPKLVKIGTGPLSYVDVTLHVRGGAATGATWKAPSGEVIDAFATPTSGTLTAGAQYYVSMETTARGTQMIDVVLYAPDASSMVIPVGDWTVTVTGDSGAAVTVDGYVSDDKSSWAAGAEWDASISTDTSTLGVPSTADHCIAVNAHPNHVEDPAAPWYSIYYGDYDVPADPMETQGQVRAYSPRGPRIDGVQKPDITAPDNPWVAAEYAPGLDDAPYGGFRVFGGTSGASPHVTGTAALLAQAGIKGDAARDAIRAGAASDAVTGTTPNKDYGYGRLDTAGALGVKATGAAGATPTITLSSGPASDTVTITPTVTGGDGGSDGLQVKWDDDYDGTWDAPYAAPAPHTVTATPPATRPFKARVRNASGHIAEAVIWVTFSTPPPAPPSPSPSKGCGCRMAPEAPGAAGLGLAAAAVLGAARRRRRTARRGSC